MFKQIYYKGAIYEIKFTDDPMELHDHLEITLSLLGVANAK